MAKLYFYYSAMNAGKSTTLLQSAHNYEEREMRTLFKISTCHSSRDFLSEAASSCWLNQDKYCNEDVMSVSHCH